LSSKIEIFLKIFEGKEDTLITNKNEKKENELKLSDSPDNNYIELIAEKIENDESKRFNSIASEINENSESEIPPKRERGRTMKSKVLEAKAKEPEKTPENHLNKKNFEQNIIKSDENQDHSLPRRKRGETIQTSKKPMVRILLSIFF
jgi:hypothetical protein